MGILVILSVFWPRKTKPIKANLLAFSVLRKSRKGRLTAESQGLRSADSVKMRKRNLKKQSQTKPIFRPRAGQNQLKPGVE